MPPSSSSAPAPSSSDVAAVYDRRSEAHALSSDLGERRSLSTPARALRLLLSLPARALLALLWFYQRVVSPTLPVIFSGACGCRFAPTCSHYAVEAIRRHGAFAGSFLTLRRLLKCTPLHPGGFDPVPATLRRRPICFSVSRPSTLTASP